MRLAYDTPFLGTPATDNNDLTSKDVNYSTPKALYLHGCKVTLPFIPDMWRAIETKGAPLKNKYNQQVIITSLERHGFHSITRPYSWQGHKAFLVEVITDESYHQHERVKVTRLVHMSLEEHRTWQQTFETQVKEKESFLKRERKRRNRSKQQNRQKAFEYECLQAGVTPKQAPERRKRPALLP